MSKFPEFYIRVQTQSHEEYELSVEENEASLGDMGIV
jgi:hypothetical protein